MGVPGAQPGEPSAPQGEPSAPQGEPSAPQGEPSAPQGEPSIPPADPYGPREAAMGDPYSLSSKEVRQISSNPAVHEALRRQAFLIKSKEMYQSITVLILDEFMYILHVHTY
ncbi:hypothetical protein OESDEN_11171 [Oesophagostomum dentatum]|uniref:Uncharacterized protein n=1 Tax=Oesophagostomum dentatum TaxID=61180 RepID=A0A0B1SZS4_OESDE|nr:hypothetical protein OESDEN_11171 [Oesophagostomum dentatum]